MGEAKQHGKEEHGKASIIHFSFEPKHVYWTVYLIVKWLPLFFFLQVTLPVYLNFTRTDLIFTVDFDIATKEDPHNFYERGVAALCTE